MKVEGCRRQDRPSRENEYQVDLDRSQEAPHVRDKTTETGGSLQLLAQFDVELP